MSRPLNILIVEDEALLAYQLQDDLTEAGHAVVGCAASAAHALKLAAETRPDLALVDIHLADGPTGVGVAQRLAEANRDTAVLFMTANMKRIPDGFCGALGVIGKPHTAHGIRRAMAFVARALDGGAPPPPPVGLILAPHCTPGEDGSYRIVRLPVPTGSRGPH